MSHNDDDINTRASRYFAAIQRIKGERELSESDMVYVELVASMVAQIEEARAVIARDGVLSSEGAHPGFEIVKKMSMEIRGWVERRPDLFGQHKVPGRHETKTRRERFKVVTGTDLATR